jgi:hypothetical protein
LFELKPLSGQLSAYSGENLDLDSSIATGMSMLFTEVTGNEEHW